MAAKQCGNCLFFAETGQIEGWGYCRRFPPAASAGGTHIDPRSPAWRIIPHVPGPRRQEPRFPFTKADMWCGEHAGSASTNDSPGVR